ncbi:hypothetical protein [Paenibacillus mucilaginosus]|uniref:Uncharacterized protein n=3 Tax=Paenibacillus mucilaginosus TaxID=61624 RepID=H6NL33_9BACL|nr:hypothetical protein [Paenibacillus mucilaginosus]AEI41181.1 hypothetical protein KNP414_02620 [Paenibacillus mucilaginosus KNP414]AFC29740.1 hypothetical protein PM3016_2866 [Paenibacillus mucilaginosus 3016]AFH61925.1 hypothetical protein B2K_14565 [Paenibacillus mucilaginosus K02]MCG7211391.1 hypothetical protein [Paenibacillus mucilaginosus]WDM30230.1 hypothetical protein KCX80_14235 [Paenibacillus mucilaginosus]
MSNSKDLLQSKLKAWKSAATSLISSPEGETEINSHVIELEPEYYEKCRQMAEAQHTTVSGAVHYMIEQFFAVRSHEVMFQATVEQKEKNPLLQLDALTKRRDRRTEEAEEYERT